MYLFVVDCLGSSDERGVSQESSAKAIPNSHAIYTTAAKGPGCRLACVGDILDAESGM
jgi:hypothetical protein